MGESTHISVVARIDFARIGWTKLDFVFFRVIEFFNSVVWSWTAIIHRTFIMSGAIDYVRTYFTCVGTERSSSIFLSFMIEEALLWVMLVRYFTLLCLKVIEIYVSYYIIILSISLSLYNTRRKYCRLRFRVILILVLLNLSRKCVKLVKRWIWRDSRFNHTIIFISLASYLASTKILITWVLILC